MIIDARNSSKREINWTGYKVHLTETCDDKTPNFIISVETTVATNPDGETAFLIHQKLDYLIITFCLFKLILSEGSYPLFASSILQEVRDLLYG